MALVGLLRPVSGLVKEPGLHVKLPLILDVHRFDKRWLEFDGDAREITTRDKKYIWVDTYARWRIADPLRVYQAVRDDVRAQADRRTQPLRGPGPRRRDPRPEGKGHPCADLGRLHRK